MIDFVTKQGDKEYYNIPVNILRKAFGLGKPDDEQYVKDTAELLQHAVAAQVEPKGYANVWVVQWELTEHFTVDNAKALVSLLIVLSSSEMS